MGIEKAVYLAGPITGLSFRGATSWRAYATEYLASHNIAGVSPLRGKEYLQEESSLAKSYSDKAMSTPRGIMTRDFFDCTRCGVVIANLLGAGKPSLGTVMEMAWCYSSRVPLIVCMEEAGNLHDHPMVNEATGYRTTDLEEALDIAVKLFTGYRVSS